MRFEEGGSVIGRQEGDFAVQKSAVDENALEALLIEPQVHLSDLEEVAKGAIAGLAGWKVKGRGQGAPRRVQKIFAGRS